jgi:predicted dinucleotide-binding enzyme
MHVAIGSGKIGATLARRFTQTGREVTLANSRGPCSLEPLVAGLGPQAHAAAVVAQPTDDIGFDAIDHAGLAAGRAQQPGSSVFGVQLTLAQTTGAS